MNEQIVQNYLIGGRVGRNIVFQNSDTNLYAEAKEIIKTNPNDCVVSIVDFNAEDEICLTKFLNELEDRHKPYMAYLYVSTKIMSTFPDDYLKKIRFDKEDIIEPKKMFEEQDISKIRENITKLNFFDIISMQISHRDLPRLDISIFEDNITLVPLQRTINDLLASRNPFGLKVFNNTKKFCSNVTTHGVFVEPSHDYGLAFPSLAKQTENENIRTV